jgi:hypothetical protein
MWSRKACFPVSLGNTRTWGNRGGRLTFSILSEKQQAVSGLDVPVASRYLGTGNRLSSQLSLPEGSSIRSYLWYDFGEFQATKRVAIHSHFLHHIGCLIFIVLDCWHSFQVFLTYCFEASSNRNKVLFKTTNCTDRNFCSILRISHHGKFGTRQYPAISDMSPSYDQGQSSSKPLAFKMMKVMILCGDI